MKKIGFITGVGGGGGGSTEYTQAEKTKLAGIEAGATVGATAAQAAKLTELESKTSEISKEATTNDNNDIIITDDSNNIVGKIDASGANFKNLKSNGTAVLTSHQDISEKADKVDVDVLLDKTKGVTTGNPTSSNDYISIVDDNNTQVVKIGVDGSSITGFLKKNGIEVPNLNEVNNEIKKVNVSKWSSKLDTYIQGTITNSTGEDLSSSSRVRTDYLSISYYVVEFPSNIIGFVYEYDSNKNYIDGTRSSLVSGNIYSFSNPFVRMTFLYADQTTQLSPNEAKEIIRVYAQVNGFETDNGDELRVYGKNKESWGLLVDDDGISSNAFNVYNEIGEKVLSIDKNTVLNTNASPDCGSFLNNSVGEHLFANNVKQSLNILGFGNSFMRNSVHFLSALANGCGVNLTVGNLYTGGTALSTQYDSLKRGLADQNWYLYENGTNTVSQGNQVAREKLQSKRWDIVILHQYQPWSQDFQPWLNKMVELITEVLGYCPKFYLNATWSAIIPSLPEATKYYGYTSEMEMLEAIWDYNKNASKTSGIIGIVPIGTAIQNARTLSWADSYNRFWNLGSDAQKDLHHLNAAGGFIAAATMYEKIVYPLTKIHCSQTTLRIPTAIAMPPQWIVEQGIIVTDDNYLPLCNSAIKAVENPFSVTTI